MKRINLTIILTILLTMSFSTVNLASGVGSAGETIGVIEGTKTDPRTDSRYAEKFNFSASETNGLKFYDDIVINYHSYQSDKVYGLNAYGRIYSSQERFCFYTTAENKEGFGEIYNLNYILVEGEQTLITYAYSQANGLFYFVCDKLKQEASHTVASNLDYFRQEGFEIVECSVPVFSNYDDAIFYINTGEIRNAIYEPEKDTPILDSITAEQIYLDDFQAIYHDAPKLDDCYIEFKYSIPKHLRNVKGSLYIDLFDVYKSACEFLVAGHPSDDTFGKNLINVNDNPYGFSMAITDFPSIQQCFMDDDKLGLINGTIKRQILGNELVVDFDNLTFKGIGLNTIAKITRSQLFLDVQLRLGTKTLGKNGVKYTAFVDFLNLKNCYYESSKYDETTDTYHSNNDMIKDGYYSVDADKNYNYHSAVGDMQTITNYDYDNSTNSTQYITNNYYGGGGGGSGDGGNATANAVVGDININVNSGHGEYVSLSPADYKLFLDSIKSLLGEFDNEGGLFLLLTDVMHVFPAEIVTIIGAGLSAVVLVVIFCILKK